MMGNLRFKMQDFGKSGFGQDGDAVDEMTEIKVDVFHRNRQHAG